MQIFNQIFERQKSKEEFRRWEESDGYCFRSEERLQFNQNIEVLSEKTPQAAQALPEEEIGLNCVQSFISNMSAAISLEELGFTNGVTLPEELLRNSSVEWTAPSWAKAGDVVFFMHAKTARSRITALQTELRNNREMLSLSDYDRLMGYIEHALEIHSKLGGKIFATGRVCGGSKYVNPEEVMDGGLHWKSRHYSVIDNIQALKTPIDISEFHDYIELSRGGATTPLVDQEFNRLRDDLICKNELPEYILQAVARPIPLRMINAKNWIEVANAYRRCFIYEKQFRRFYVDYLLKDIGERRRYFTECRCQRDDITDSFMDYVIRFDGKYLPVETKLAVNAEPNIVGQVSKYVHNSRVFLEENGERRISGNAFHDGKVLIIDTDRIYMYDDDFQKVKGIFDLNKLNSKTDIEAIKKVIGQNL